MGGVSQKEMFGGLWGVPYLVPKNITTPDDSGNGNFIGRRMGLSHICGQLGEFEKEEDCVLIYLARSVGGAQQRYVDHDHTHSRNWSFSRIKVGFESH